MKTTDKGRLDLFRDLVTRDYYVWT